MPVPDWSVKSASALTMLSASCCALLRVEVLAAAVDRGVPEVVDRLRARPAPVGRQASWRAPAVMASMPFG